MLEVKSADNIEWWLNPSHVVAVRLDTKQIYTTSGDFLILDDESFAKLKEHEFPTKRTTKKSEEPKSELHELFNELHKLTGGKGATVFTPQREKKLNDLLTKSRMTKENLLTAAKNIGNDDFLQGENDNKKRYGNIDYLLRPDKAAMWSEEREEKKKRMF